MLRNATAAAIGVIGALSILSPTTALAAAPAVPRAHRAAASQNATVTISTNCASFCFAPARATITAGVTVTWVDKSSTRHNVSRCDPANCSGANGGTGSDASFTAAHLAVPAGGTANFTFTQPGTYVYYCAIHGYALMHGTITVVAAEVTTVPPVAAPVTAAPVVAAPTTAAGPRLASNGSGTGSALATALALLVVGSAATAFRLGRRFS